MRWKKPSRRRNIRSRRSSAAPRFRPSSTCSAICSSKVETLIIGGGMANTFLAAQGKPVGKSLCENDLIGDRARHSRQGQIAQPRNRAAGRRRGGAEIRRPCAVARRRRSIEVGADDMILDIGPRSDRARRLGAGAHQDPGLERPVRRLRDRAVRQRHHRGRRGGRGTHRRPASLSVLPAAAIPWRRSMSPASRAA